MARSAELAVRAGRVEFAEEVFVEVALHVLVLAGDVHAFDGAAGFDQQAGLVDLEFGVGHLLAEGAGFLAELFEEREDLLLDLLERLFRRKLAPMRPAEFLSLVGLGEERLKLPAASSSALGILLALVKLFQEEQVRKLFDGVQRIGKAAGPELVPERFDLGAELRIGEHGV